MKIGIGSDHAGFDMKNFLKKELEKDGYEIIDCGTEVKKSVDYPDFAAKVVEKIMKKEVEMGILICGTGLGMSIAANKFKGIRAARCCNIFDAVLARQHNNANILTLGGRLIGNFFALEITKTFLETPFLRGRHLRRVNKIKKFEK